MSARPPAALDQTGQNWPDRTDGTHRTDRTGGGLDWPGWGGGLDRSDIRGEEDSQKKKKSEDPSGSVRDITHHLIHDSKTSTPVPCVAFHKESHAYDPRSI